MPSSTRPTGEVKVQFFDFVDGEYYLVDESSKSDLLRASPGELTDLKVEPKVNMTYWTDEVQISLRL